MLTKTGLHAIRAMVALARLPAGQYAGAAAIAREIGAPQNYLAKLLQQLAREGLVESQKGLGGGFRLARDARAITLFDVVEPIEHVSRWSGCILGHERCLDEQPCALHERWKAVREAYLRLLRRSTIAELLKKGELELIPG
jgi:Rrf2 family iron-sulfur cluster assembly transcriptional regulator